MTEAKCYAKGFSQIPGKDFQENHVPVVSDTILHLLMVIKTMLKLEAGQFEIETASLYGKTRGRSMDGYPRRI
jgi:hypothetical protein